MRPSESGASVSVVIPCFNGMPYLKEAVESALSQGIDGLEIVVVDDGSTDGGPEMVRTHYPSVKLLSTGSPRSGPSRARNIGTSASSGRLLQYLDADDVLAPGKLAAQRAALVAADADVAYGEWHEIRRSAGGEFEVVRRVDKRLPVDAETALLTDFWCPPAAYLFSRRIVEKIGGWHENLRVIQDARFVQDCAMAGGRFVHCPGVQALYRVHSYQSVSHADQTVFFRECLASAVEIERRWAAEGQLNATRTAALVKVYAGIAHISHEKDSILFQDSVSSVLRLDPRYVPTQSAVLALISRAAGYANAERAAAFYRKVKRRLGLAKKPGKDAL